MLRTDLIGNLGADPEVRFSQQGAEIVSFRVAVTLRQRNDAGEWNEVTEWIGVRVMGRQVDYAKRMTKGTRVYVTGALDVRHYTGRDGKPGTALDVWADEIAAMSSARDSDNGAAPKASTTPATSTPKRGAADEVEDLPF